ncbi:MAG: hypothetical protein ACRDJX_06135, partial [Solirubrobacteraceae bacterium]
VDHSENLIFLDPVGRERIVNEGMANVHGHLEKTLRRLLNDAGLHNLEHPSLPWTSTQALEDLDWLMSGKLPPARAS